MKNALMRNIKNKIVAIFIFLQILFFLFCIITISFKRMPHTANSRRESKTERYTSVRVCSGESLWEISGRFYSEEYENMRSYVHKIMKLNNLSDEDIYSGTYLIIPYYD